MTDERVALSDAECMAIADAVGREMGAHGGTLTESEGHYLRNFGFALIRAGYRAAHSAGAGVPLFSNWQWKHVKAGGEYEIIAEARVEASDGVVVVYRSVETGQVWTRPVAEFYDGRFVRSRPVAAPASVAQRAEPATEQPSVLSSVCQWHGIEGHCVLTRGHLGVHRIAAAEPAKAQGSTMDGAVSATSNDAETIPCSPVSDSPGVTSAAPSTPPTGDAQAPTPAPADELPSDGGLPMEHRIVLIDWKARAESAEADAETMRAALAELVAAWDANPDPDDITHRQIDAWQAARAALAAGAKGEKK